MFKKLGLNQMFKSAMLGAFGTATDYICFAILQFFVFNSLTNVPFHFGPFNYEVADGGLCYFLSMAISYVVGSVVNYFVQKRYAFDAKGTTNSNTFIRFFLSILLNYMIYLYIPGLISVHINKLFGIAIGPIVTKIISQFICFVIQYPVNKYFVFRSRKIAKMRAEGKEKVV